MQSEKLEKKTMQFREGDWEFLTDTYQPRGLTTSKLIRELVAEHVDKLRASQRSQISNINMEP